MIASNLLLRNQPEEQSGPSKKQQRDCSYQAAADLTEAFLEKLQQNSIEPNYKCT